MKELKLSYKAFIVKKLNGEIYLCKQDPRIEDGEHLYCDVCEGEFYAITNSDDGIVHDTEKNRWLVVRNSQCATKWSSSKNEALKRFKLGEILWINFLILLNVDIFLVLSILSK